MKSGGSSTIHDQLSEVLLAIVELYEGRQQHGMAMSFRLQADRVEQFSSEQAVRHLSTAKLLLDKLRQ